MKKAIVLIMAALLAVFLLGCAQQDGYTAYSQQPPAGQQGQYFGGGCGLAPHADGNAPNFDLPSSL